MCSKPDGALRSEGTKIWNLAVEGNGDCLFLQFQSDTYLGENERQECFETTSDYQDCAPQVSYPIQH